jgi:hypothetical protein
MDRFRPTGCNPLRAACHIWDKLRAQQASCLLNKPSAWHVLMGLNCLINLNFFFAAQLSFVSYMFLPGAT